MRKAFLVGTLGLIWLTGCELLEEGSGSTNSDPCVVDPGSCATASSGEFGTVTLESESTDDVFLLWVQSIPSTASVADNYITFSLSGGGEGNASALTASSSASAGLRWGGEAQLAFDNARHAGIARLVSAMKTGERQVAALMRPLAGTHPCAVNEIQHNGECVGELSLNWGRESARTFQVQDYVERDDQIFYVLVDSEDVANAGDAREAAENFASTFAKEHALLGLNGHAGSIDHNADGAITLAFSTHTGGGISQTMAGFFDYRDMLPASDEEATGNEMDILWARPPSSTIPMALTVATLAHEYAHLASFALRVSGQGASASQEALWLDEGIAHTIEDLTGWGPSNIDAVEATLMDWSDTALAGPLDSVANRGMAYLFLRHLVDAEAKANGATNANSAAVEAASASILGGMMQESSSGFEHPGLAGLSQSQHANWVLASFVTGADYLEGAHRADFLSPAVAGTGNKTGIDTHGMFSNGAGDAVPLDGPASNDLDDLSSSYDGELMESGSVFLLVTELEPGSHEITGRSDDAAGLRLHVERIE